MWNNPNLSLFKNATSQNKKINMDIVITFNQSGNDIHFLTARPHQTIISFGTKEECNLAYEYLIHRFCHEIELKMLKDDLPF